MPLSYVAPLIGFALTAVPILAGTEYLHRPTFTRLLREKLGAPDLVAIDRYYSLDPRSRVMVFEHEGHISGLVAFDGARAGQGLKSVLGAEEGQLGEQEGVIEEIGFEKQSPRGTQSEREGLRKRSVRSSTDAITRSNGSLVQIRHLDVDIVVRRAGVATELLVAVLDHAFGISPCPGSKDILKPAEKVVLLTNPLSPGGEKLLRKCGFVPVGQGEAEDWVKAEKVGLFGWKGRWLGVSRSEWRAKREVLFAKK